MASRRAACFDGGRFACGETGVSRVSQAPVAVERVAL
jgi:hypothetical protein